MTRLQKILVLEFWFFLWLPILGAIMIFTLKIAGLLLFSFLCVFWFWQLFAYTHYRFCRQEEFLFILQTAADAQAPVEAMLKAYLKDRPRDEAYRFWLSSLLTFVFPGYYWVHKRRSFDFRLARLAAMMQSGATLNQALGRTPGLVSRETALAVAVGQFSGKLAQALHQLPDRRFALQWLEMMPRLAYPLMVLGFMVVTLSFIMIFIIPRFERIFMDFRMRLPEESEILIAASRTAIRYWYVGAIIGVIAFLVVNILVLSTRFRWHFPLFGRLYRQHARGQFLHVLGLMLETGRPLPEILGYVLSSGFLPSAVSDRGYRLLRRLREGEPLADALVDCGLATSAQRGLIQSAEKTQNLPWALQSMGESSVRRCAMFTQRLGMVIFPLTIVVCAVLVGGVAIAVFKPLIELLEGLNV
jgi:type IV pilus assembly protein PilC